MTAIKEQEVSMDKTREDFEAWFVGKYPRSRNGVRTWDGREGSTDYISDYARSHWEAWQASRKAATPVAYLTHHGIAVGPDDFNGGADEMTLTARSEGWSPLIVGITVKGEGDDTQSQNSA